MKLGVAYDTCINGANREKFDLAVKEGEVDYSCSIRNKAMELMEQGNVAMTIFLCKAVLGMSDRPERELPEASPLDGLAKALEGSR